MSAVVHPRSDHNGAQGPALSRRKVVTGAAGIGLAPLQPGP